MPTTLATPATTKRQWILIDAKDQVLGRLSSRIALILRGRHKVTYTPYVDTGDFVVVINASQLRLSGQKRQQKLYQRYSGYPGGRSVQTLDEVLLKSPDRIIRQAVRGMMPDGPLSRQMLRKLKIYSGSDHPHSAQQPAVSQAWITPRRAVHG